MNEDWTSIFRSHQVDEYVLIGECDDGQCGESWETWGNPNSFVEDFDVKVEAESTGDISSTTSGSETNTKLPLIPYELDGYTRHDLNELASDQFSRFDCQSSKTGRTVSFRKSSNR